MRQLVVVLAATSLLGFGYAAAQEDHSKHQPPPADAAPKSGQQAEAAHDMHAQCMAMMQARQGEASAGGGGAPKMKMKMKMKAGEMPQHCADMMKDHAGHAAPPADEKAK